MIVVLVLLMLAPGGEPPTDSRTTSTHWAYRRPVEIPLPSAHLEGWDRHPIDLFVAARLADAGLEPRPEAAPEVLLRRASLDLTGLPPRLEELDAFLADSAPGAWERALERLFASPHYGEHQAARWLDLARYADSRGYEKDDRREMWRYRDWVIEAFQRDLAFDRFTLEQLAGDLLPEATLDQRLATGFHRNTLVNEEGGTDPEEFRVAAVKDRVNTTALVWLGTTLECAQCHDHKYDPFSQEEYYRFYAFFDGTEDTGNSDAPTIAAPTRAFEVRARELESEREALRASLTALATAVDRETWSGAWSAATAHWRVERPESFHAPQGSRLARLEDDSVLAIGEPPDVDDYVLEFAPEPGPVAGLRLEVLTDASLPDDGPGRPSHRNFVLSRVTLAVDGAPVPIRALRADAHQPNFAPAGALDEDPRSGWAIGGAEGQSHALHIELEEPLELGIGARLTLGLEQRYGSQHLIGRVRVATCASLPDAPAPIPSPEIEALLGAEPSEAADARLAAWYAERAPSLAPVRERLAAIQRELEPPRAMVLSELPEGRRTHVQVRGNFLAPGAEVTPGVPAVLGSLGASSARGTRLDLARWLVAPENPLTARVSVNRAWQRIFGTGLVATDNDFGLRGEAPSHPELLDWLALEFQARGWSHRELLRLILTSATYRQSSAATPTLLELDPGNRLLARGAKLRLEAESLRDSALRVSGLLCPKIGGPSVFPPQPEGVWLSPYSGDRWSESVGEERYRRGLYTFLKRSAPYPTFLLFDAPSRELACSRRMPSNTPLQALALLNDPAFVECAEALAEAMRDHAARAPGAGPRDGLRHGFRLCTAREPAEEELSILEGLFEAERAARSSRAAQEPDVPSTHELLPWKAIASVLLNLDEAITKS